MFATTLRFLTLIVLPKPTVFITPSLYADPYTRPHPRLPPDTSTTSTHLFASPSPARYEGSKCARTRSHSDASSSTSNQNRNSSFGPAPASTSTPREPAQNKNNRNTPGRCCPCSCHPPAPRSVEIMDEHTSIFRGAGILLEPPSPSPRSRGLSPFELKLKESGMVQESREDQDRWAPQQNIPIDGSIQHQHTQRGVDRTHALEDVVFRASDGGGSLAFGRIVRDSGKVSAGKALRRTKGVIVSRRVDPQAPQQDQIPLSRTHSRSRSHLQQKSFELELSPIIEDTHMFSPTLAFGATTNTTSATNNDTDTSILVSDANLSSDDSDEFVDTSPSKFKPQRPVFHDLSNTHPHGTAAPEIPALTLTIPTPELRNTLMFQPQYGDGDATQSQRQLSSDPRALASLLQVDDSSDPRPNALELEYSRGRPGAPSSDYPGLGIGVRVDGVAELGNAPGQKGRGSRVSKAWKKALLWAFSFKGDEVGQLGGKAGMKDKEGTHRKGWFGSVWSAAAAEAAKAKARRSAEPRGSNSAIKLGKQKSTSAARGQHNGIPTMELREEGGPADQSNGPPANGTGGRRSASKALDPLAARILLDTL